MPRWQTHLFTNKNNTLTMSSLRFKVVDEAFNRKAETVAIPAERPDAYYGKQVFDHHLADKLAKY